MSVVLVVSQAAMLPVKMADHVMFTFSGDCVRAETCLLLASETAADDQILQELEHWVLKSGLFSKPVVWRFLSVVNSWRDISLSVNKAVGLHISIVQG